MSESLKAWFDGLVNWVANTGVNVVLKVVIALIIMFISFKIINVISRRIARKGDDPKHDKTVMRTLAYVVSIAAKCVVAVSLIGFLGIDTSAITALIASLGVCIGLAVNGAVSNLAGGVLLIVTRPFKIDDFIEAQGYSGTVEAIHLTTTKLRTPDNKVVYVPNGPLSTGNIVNYSEKPTRRVDFKFSIGYADDFDKAKSILFNICSSHELVLKDKDITIRVSEHGESSINIIARVWVNSPDYWTVNFDIIEAVKRAFDENGITIPYNQLDVHVINN